MSSNLPLFELQAAIMDMVAPKNWREMNVYRLHVELTPAAWPKVVLHCDARSDGPVLANPIRVRHVYTLQADEEHQPTDWDAEAANAMARVRAHVNQAATTALREIKKGFELAHARATSRHLYARAGHRLSRTYDRDFFSEVHL